MKAEMKVEIDDSSSKSAPEGEHHPPQQEGSSDSGDENLQSSTEVQSSPNGSDSSTILPPDAPSPDMTAEDHSGNLVGKMNNLVTTDLQNIVASRDFMMILISMPLQIALCIWFLYAILDWRCARETHSSQSGSSVPLYRQCFRWAGSDPFVIFCSGICWERHPRCSGGVNETNRCTSATGDPKQVLFSFFFFFQIFDC